MLATAQPAIAVVGIDIGKNSFHVVGLDDRGAIRSLCCALAAIGHAAAAPPSRRPVAASLMRILTPSQQIVVRGGLRPAVRNASITIESIKVPRDDHVHGSFASSARVTLRRRAHGLSTPATITRGSSSSTSWSISSGGFGSEMRAKPRSMRRSRNSSHNARIPPTTT